MRVTKCTEDVNKYDKNVQIIFSSCKRVYLKIRCVFQDMIAVFVLDISLSALKTIKNM